MGRIRRNVSLALACSLSRCFAVLISTLAMALPVRAQANWKSADSLLVCQLLGEADREENTLWFAQKLIGRPYVAHTLEILPEEQLIVNTRQLDCTTFVETVCALTLCAAEGRPDFSRFCHFLKTLRYRRGVLDGYTSRLHYFSDWIIDNQEMGLVEEIRQQPPFSAVQRLNINYMSRHSGQYAALKQNPHLVSVIRQQENALTGKAVRYIPKKDVLNTSLMRRTISDGDIIAITCNKPGLDIAHLGFAVWRKDGLHLLNASMLHKRVITEPMTLYQYLQKHPTFTGIRVIRLKTSRQQAAR